MKLDKYWNKLDSIGWLRYIPKGDQPKIREQLGKNLVEGSRYACLALASTALDMECIEGDNAYGNILKELKSASQGAFHPDSIKEVLDTQLEVIRLGFKHGGKKYAIEVPWQSDFFDMQVLDLVNQALADNHSTARFLPLPTSDQIMPLVFVSPSVYMNAVKAKLIPKADPYVGELLSGGAKKQKAENQRERELLAQLNHKNPWNRTCAIMDLGETTARAKHAFPHLLSALDDTDEQVRVAAAEGLARVGKMARPALERSLQDSHPLVRVAAANSLWIIGRLPAAINCLIEVVQTEKGRFRQNGLLGLQQVGKAAQSALPIVIEALDDPEWFNYEGASDVIMALGPKALSAVPTLKRCLRIKGRTYYALWTLSTIGPVASSALPEIMKSLNDKSWEVRMRAAEAIGAIGPQAKKAVPWLIKILKDTAAVSSMAAVALGQIGQAAKGAVSALLDCFKSRSERLHIDAARALLLIDPAAARKALPQLEEILSRWKKHVFRQELTKVIRALQ